MDDRPPHTFAIDTSVRLKSHLALLQPEQMLICVIPRRQFPLNPFFDDPKEDLVIESSDEIHARVYSPKRRCRLPPSPRVGWRLTRRPSCTISVGQ